MLRQITPVFRTVSNFSRIGVRATSSAAHGHEHHKSDLEVAREYRNTLNDIPVPQGSWQEDYDKRNAKWNMMLGASVAFFVVSMYVTKQHANFHTFRLSEMKKLKLDVD